MGSEWRRINTTTKQEAMLKATAVRSPLAVMSSILPCPPSLPPVMLSAGGKVWLWGVQPKGVFGQGGGGLGWGGRGAGYISSTLPYTAPPHGASPWRDFAQSAKAARFPTHRHTLSPEVVLRYGSKSNVSVTQIWQIPPQLLFFTKKQTYLFCTERNPWTWPKGDSTGRQWGAAASRATWFRPRNYPSVRPAAEPRAHLQDTEAGNVLKCKQMKWSLVDCVCGNMIFALACRQWK